MVLYDHDSHSILAEPLTSRNKRDLIRATRILHTYLSDRGLTPQYGMLDNECPGILLHDALPICHGNGQDLPIAVTDRKSVV